jgi:hypothetical protein
MVAAPTLLVDVVGLAVPVWKIILSLASLTRLAP